MKHFLMFLLVVFLFCDSQSQNAFDISDNGYVSITLSSVSFAKNERVFTGDGFEDNYIWEDSNSISQKLIIDEENSTLYIDNTQKSTYYMQDLIATSDFYLDAGDLIDFWAFDSYDEEQIHCEFIIYYNNDSGVYTFIAEYIDIAYKWVSESYANKDIQTFTL